MSDFERGTAMTDPAVEDAMRDAMYLALLVAKVNGSPVHEHLGDLLDAVVPDTLANLDGYTLVTNEQAAMLQPLRKAQDRVPMTDPEQVQPHRYMPDAMAMGDCRKCGHVADSPLHAVKDPEQVQRLAEADDRQRAEELRALDDAIRPLQRGMNPHPERLIYATRNNLRAAGYRVVKAANLEPTQAERDMAALARWFKAVGPDHQTTISPPGVLSDGWTISALSGPVDTEGTGPTPEAAVKAALDE